MFIILLLFLLIVCFLCCPGTIQNGIWLFVRFSFITKELYPLKLVFLFFPVSLLDPPYECMIFRGPPRNINKHTNTQAVMESSGGLWGGAISQG